jgi:raffinose/stachyose/melibiose transport system substrate-binding protein
MKATRQHIRNLGLTLMTTTVGTSVLLAGAQGGKTITMVAGPYSPTAATTVSAANPRVVTALRELAAKFEKQTGITVKFADPAITGADNGIDRGKWEAYLQSTIAAGNAVDVVYVPQGPDQSSKGWFMALDDLYTKPNAFASGNTRWRDLFFPKALDRLKGVGGKQYVLPFASNYPYIIIGTFYNKELMAKAGITSPPKTWEEWMKQLAQLKKAGISPMAPFPAESKTGSVWPMWSTLVPPFTAHLVSKVDTDKSGEVSPIEIAKAVKAGVISMSDLHFQAAWLQYKRQLSFYLPGWNAADIPAAWNQGKVAQKYGGFWEIFAEKSNTQRKFEWGFLPTLPVTKATSSLVTWTPKLAPTGKARLEGIDGAAHQYAIVESSVKRNNNLDAVSQWLQFITTPDANEFVVNENPDAIPGVRGANPDPLWNQLADMPVPDFGPTLYPFSIDQEQQSNAQREVVGWALGQKTNKAFFDSIQKDMMRATEKFLAANK